MMTRENKRLSLSTLLILALTAVVPLAVATGFSNFERPRQIVLAGVAALALVAWGVDVIRGKGPQIASPQTLALGGAFVAMVVASLAWSSQWMFGALSVVTWTGLAVVFVVLVAPVGRRPRFLDWATAVAAGTIGAGGMGLYEFFVGDAIHPIWDAAGVTGGFDGMAFAAAYYAMAVPLLAGALALSTGVRRWFVALAFLLGIAHLGLVVDGLILGVLVGAMVVAALLVWLVGGVSALGRRVALTGLAAVLIAGVSVAGLMGFDRPETENVAVDLPRVASSPELAEEMAAQERLTWWYFAADRMEAPVDYRYRSYLNSVARGLWDQEPVLGHGAGGWALMQTDVIDDSDPVVNKLFDRYPAFASPHSDYARVSVEQGVLGLILLLLWLAGVVTAVVRGLRARRDDGGIDDEDSIASWALATVLLAGMALMIFVPFLELISSGVLWMGAAALGVGHAASASTDSQWLKKIDAADAPLMIRAPVALASVTVAVVMVIPAANHGQAALERGYADHRMLHSQFDGELLEEAIDHYLAAHEAYPAYAAPLYNAAIAKHKTGRTDEGWELMQEAVELRPYDGRMQTHLASLALRTHRVETALERGAEAVRTAPNYADAYEVYGAALQRRARYGSAAELFEAFLERQPPKEIRGTYRVRYAHILSRQLERPEEALEQYELALDELPVGSERMLIFDQIDELEARVERQRLEDEGKPIPPQLQPEQFEHHHDHDHGFDIDFDFDHGFDGDHHDHDHGPDFDSDPLHHLEQH